MASSSSSQQLQAADETRNWLELPRDVTATILHKLGAIEILESAQKVCTTWRSICKDPAMWRTIDMYDPGDLPNKAYDLEKMAMHAIDRSCGELVDIKVEYFGTDELLQYIAERWGSIAAYKWHVWRTQLNWRLRSLCGAFIGKVFITRSMLYPFCFCLHL
ncbi:F-box protein SKIP19-like isoform X3 [Actinidia eriantha]|uniref:F-box protein SKIP19-like isoform X3 n=1 Tax=Actinidia eriantha TaxID=165200 RepID=UPI0025897BD6|nr:F-box protein SKIP19-like isoform X3 [Actinidia eriantha]